MKEMFQRIITPGDNYAGLENWITELGVKKILLVCDGSIWYQKAFNEHLEVMDEQLGVQMVGFRDFQPNPLYENVQDGVKLFRDEECDAIIAVGGGSAIDVAKCIKLYGNLPGDGENGSWLTAEYVPNDIPFLAMPTTAGTGSEATRYAVIYYAGKKQSVTSERFIPDTVLMDPETLKTLPPYQKATMMDALCHAIESFWSVNSTDESKEYSKAAIQGIMEHMEGYLANTEEGRAGMLRAANTAGKAINITQTTAGHAMCYKVTSLFKSAHGHAAVLCDRVLFPWMIENTDKCIDPRGEEYLKKALVEIGQAMGCAGAKAGAEKLVEIFNGLELEVPTATEAQFEELKTSVNPVRLKNHPIALDVETIDMLYHRILNGAE